MLKHFLLSDEVPFQAENDFPPSVGRQAHVEMMQVPFSLSHTHTHTTVGLMKSRGATDRHSSCTNEPTQALDRWVLLLPPLLLLRLQLLGQLAPSGCVTSRANAQRRVKKVTYVGGYRLERPPTC